MAPSPAAPTGGGAGDAERQFRPASAVATATQEDNHLNSGRVGRLVPLRLELRGPVLLVTLDRPEVHNAIDPEMHAELVGAWERFRDNERLRVAVLTGAGDKAFSAGIDLTRLDSFYAESYPGERRERWKQVPGLGGLTRNFDAGKPIIAAINGHCLGLGLELALACDLRLASPNATLGLPEVRWGIIPGQGGTQRLPRAVPTNIALEMILTGAPISASRAAEVGLVNRVVPLPRLRAEAFELAVKIAGHPVEAVRRARRAVWGGLDRPLDLALDLEQDLAEPLRGGPNAGAARAAFDRRKRRRAASPKAGRRGRRRP